MVSVVNALLFKGGPFPNANQLVQVMAGSPRGDIRLFSEIENKEIRAHASKLSSVTAVSFEYSSTGEGGYSTERIRAAVVSENFSTTFGVPAALGRTFALEEFQPGGGSNVAVLTYAYWQKRFGGKDEVIGQHILLNHVPVTIIGVMPQSFEYRMLWGNIQLWRPRELTSRQSEDRGDRSFLLYARLVPNVSVREVTSELSPLGELQQQEHPEAYLRVRYRVIPLQSALMGQLGERLIWMLLGLSVFVLLIACANLASLQLARATANIRDLSIRAALGASQWRLISYQLTECVILSITGGAIGLVIASGLNRFIERSVLFGGEPGLQISLDTTVLIVSLNISAITGVLFGIVPAIVASRADLNALLKQQSRGSTGGRASQRIRHALVVSEVALALVLLGGAAVLQRGFAGSLNQNSGWNIDQILTATFEIPELRYDTPEKKRDVLERIERRLRQIPGVAHVALASSVPIFSYTNALQVITAQQSEADQATLPTAFHVMISDDYFRTFGAQIVQGHAFSLATTKDGPPVAVVNQALARALWPTTSPVGQKLGTLGARGIQWAEVIGVVTDLEPAGSITDPSTRFQVYRPLIQEPSSRVHVALAVTSPTSMLETLRRAISEVDPDLSIDRIGAARQLVQWAQHNLFVVSQTLTMFAALGLILAVVGIYGVISALVVQRSSEFGIRLALGATPANVLGMVLLGGFRLAALGLFMGILGALAIAQLLSSLLPRLAKLDTLAISTVSGGLLIITMIACYLPARRATQVDPLTALREE